MGDAWKIVRRLFGLEQDFDKGLPACLPALVQRGIEKWIVQAVAGSEKCFKSEKK